MLRAISVTASMPPLVTISSPGAGRCPSISNRWSAIASRVLAMPSLAAYCRATAGSSRIRSAAMVARASEGNTSGAGKPPEKFTSPCAFASARIAVIDPSLPTVRWASRDVQVMVMRPPPPQTYLPMPPATSTTAPVM